MVFFCFFLFHTSPSSICAKFKLLFAINWRKAIHWFVEEKFMKKVIKDVCARKNVDKLNTDISYKYLMSHTLSHNTMMYGQFLANIERQLIFVPCNIMYYLKLVGNREICNIHNVSIYCFYIHWTNFLRFMLKSLPLVYSIRNRKTWFTNEYVARGEAHILCYIIRRKYYSLRY